MTTSEIFPFELAPGERVLWSGTPRRGLFVQPADLLQVPISLVILYVFVTQARQANLRDPMQLLLGGVIFIAVMYFAVGRFFFDAYRRGRSSYALTSERMLVKESLFSDFVKSFPLNTITDTGLREKRNGFGNIWIGRRYLPPGWQDTRLSATSGHPNGFSMIPDARHVYELLEAARLTRPAPTVESLFAARRQ